MVDIGNEMNETLKKVYSDKLDKKKDFDNYLEDMDKEYLIWLRALYAYGTNDNDFFERESEDIFNWSKEEIVEDILNLLDAKMVLLVQYLPQRLMDDLITITISEQDFFEFVPDKDNEISVLSIFMAKALGFVFCKETEGGRILVHMTEYIKAKMRMLIDCECFEYYEAVFEYTRGVVDTYGAIRIDEIYDIINDYILISPDRYFNMMMFVTATKVNLFECGVCDDIIYNNIYLNEDQAKELVNNNKLKTIYSKEMYQSMASRGYFLELEPYNRLREYLAHTYDVDLTDDEIISYLVDVIVDYINAAQVNLDEAKRSLSYHLDTMFECDEYDETTIIMYLEGIRKKMPSWKHGGKILESTQIKKVGRNQLCPCGSGKKYKECHGKNFK